MDIETKTYECVICHGINSAARIHCQFCDTIPAEYSWRKKPIRERLNTITSFQPVETFSSYIDVLVAWGCERQASNRVIKRAARTVPLGYYAEL
jgi:hypothetical protein